jgi:hypothetical protein
MRLSLAILLAILLCVPLCAADLDALLAKWKLTQMPFQSTGLDAKEKQVVDKLVEASRWLEGIYWEQGDPDGLRLYQSTQDPRIQRLIMINGSRYSLLDENRPFLDAPPMPPGRNLFPLDLTRAQIESYVQTHPLQKKAIYDSFTAVRRAGDRLETLPYHSAYARYLQPASRLLREASLITSDAKFAKYLRLRADALLNDNYYESDLAWLAMGKPKIDLIFAPMETYLDDLLGVKASYGAAVLIRNEAESAKLELYEKYVPEIQDALPLAPEDRPSKHGHLSPMEVMDAPFRTGDLLHGYQAVADNLPNDPRIHEKAGSKKIFFKNFLDARVNVIILPLAQQVMDPKQAAQASAEGYLAAVVLHEICHGLGPAYARQNGKQIDIREAIGPIFSGLEEAKADVVGMYGLKWLVDHKALPASRLEEYYASYVAGIFRTVRFGVAEAHGRGEMMQFNFLSEKGAVERKGGRYQVQFDKMPVALAELANELLQIEATGDSARAEKWFARYDKMPADLNSSLAAVKNVPVDIQPQYSWPVLPPVANH